MENKKKNCNVCVAEFEGTASTAKCSKCRSEYRKQWAIKNKEKMDAYNRQYQKDNAEYLREYKRAYRSKNPEIGRQSLREWKKRNPEKVLADGRKQDKKRAKTLARKEYMKNQRLKKHFDISLETYRQISEAQGGVCAICHKPETHLDRSGQPRQLCVDHCHKSGKIRQLLCNRCNAILGRAEDDSEILVKMAEYLKKHKE